LWSRRLWSRRWLIRTAWRLFNRSFWRTRRLNHGFLWGRWRWL
jgi:hypothetical protein